MTKIAQKIKRSDEISYKLNKIQLGRKKKITIHKLSIKIQSRITNQSMKRNQDEGSDEGIEAASGQLGAVGGNHEGIIGDTYDAENKEDHDGAKAPQGGAKLENVPRHDCSRSVHYFESKNSFTRRKNSKGEANPHSRNT